MVLQVSPALPPGFNGGEFDEVLDDLRWLIGGENVLTGSDLGNHLDPYSFCDGDPYAPSAGVLPASVEEIQSAAADSGPADQPPAAKRRTARGALQHGEIRGPAEPGSAPG